MRVALLGGGNPYALNLANLLHSLDVEHFGIGRRGPRPAPFWLTPPFYDYHVMDVIHDWVALGSLLEKRKPDVVVNFAAQGEGAASFGRDAEWFYRTNTLGMCQLVEFLSGRSWLRRFVQISTSELYGSVREPSTEESPLRPTSPYAISKAAFDLHLEAMGRTSGFPFTIIRPSNCYCPGQQPHRVIPRALIAALGGPRMTLNGGGAAEKSYLHAADLSTAILKVASRDRANGQTYNVGPKSSVQIRSVVAMTAEACGKTLDDVAAIGPMRKGEDARYWLDSSKAERELGWAPTIELPYGIQGMAEWAKKFPDFNKTDFRYTLMP